MIDTIIAMAVGVVLILSTTAVLIAANSANDAAAQNAIAYNAARQVVENLRIRKAAVIKTTTGYVDATTYGPVPQLDKLTNATANVQITNPRGILIQADVKVTWTAGDRRNANLSGAVSQRTRILTALFAKNGVAP
jgi:hypothetical protein